MPPLLSAVSIIVPTFREAPNIRSLVERTFTATTGVNLDAELIIVDDNSQDGTDAVVEEMQSEHPIQLVVRTRERGLSSAVLAGFRAATNDVLLVMDADLQHPPEMIPAMVERLAQGDCDFVLGTRYASHGTVAQDWPFLRRAASRVATWLARPLAPLSDPMSGFFALHRETWQRATKVNPIGYKIGLELYVKGRCQRPAEVPIRFETRMAGQSKLTAGVQIGYLRQLASLYWFRYPLWTIMVPILVFVAVAVAAWSTTGSPGN